MTLRQVVDIVAVLAIGALIGLMVADVGSSERHIGDWQTLIAGILAVIAAAWTVGEMRRNDRMQQSRHEELMQLNLRADRLRARRAAFPYSIEMKTVSGVLDQYPPDAFTRLASNEQQKAILVMLSCYSKLKEVIDAEALVEAKNMFGSDMAHLYRMLRENLPKIGGDESTVQSFAKYDTLADEPFELAHRFYRNMALYAVPLDDFATHLQRLARHYGPD